MTPAFCIFKRGGQVYTQVVPDCTKAEASLEGIKRGRVGPDSMIHSEGWRGYGGHGDFSFKYTIVFIMTRRRLPRRTHINGIESFGHIQNDA